MHLLTNLETSRCTATCGPRG